MKKCGVGYASIFYGTGYGNGFPDESRATAELTKDGEINVYVEVSDVGSGGISVMWQIAAETLAVDKDLVKIIFSNTSLIKDSGTAAASRQTYNTGNAVYDATKKLKENMSLANGKKLRLREVFGLGNSCYGDIENDFNRRKTEVVMDNKEVVRAENIEKIDYKIKENSHIKEKSMLKEIYNIMVKNSIQVRTEGYFKAETSQLDMETGQGNPYWPYTFGAQRVTVEVDDETGKVDVIEVIAVNDAGKIINPVSAEGQAEGGVAMGIGYALMEEIELDKGSIKNRNFSDYIIPTSKDIPHIETHFIEEIEETGPYGAKGIGEPVMIPTAPAILNAIYNAVGVRITTIPVTCDRLLLALKAKK